MPSRDEEPINVRQRIADLKVKLAATAGRDGAPVAAPALDAEQLALPGEASAGPQSSPTTARHERVKALGLSTPNLMRLLDACGAIREEDALSAEQIGYMARLLVQTTLPHSDPGPVDVWVRRNGNFTLQITPGRSIETARTKSRQLGVPFGTYPRLIMTLLTTDAVKTRSPQVHLGRSMAEFLRRLGLHVDGRVARRVKDQMQRLIFANIDWAYLSGNTDLGLGLRPIESRCTFWDVSNPEQRALFPSSVTLNLRFYNEIIEASIPLDMRVVRELARLRTTMGMDIYPWLSWRQHRLMHSESTSKTFVAWKSLQGQFGADYGRLGDFKAAFAEALRIVLELYPQGGAVPTEEGLLLTPGRPHIAPRASARRGLPVADASSRTGPGDRTS